jgi:hypothetical protein
MLNKNRTEKLVNLKDADKNSRILRVEMEKGDLPAIIIAAFLTLWPAIAIIIGLMLLLLYFVSSRA